MLTTQLNFALVSAAQADPIAVITSEESSLKEKGDACRELAPIGAKEAVAPLAALLGDERYAHMARYGLEPNPDPSVGEALHEALGKLKGLPLVGVIGSVGVRRDEKAVEALAGLLKDGDGQVVQAAARALGKIGNTEAAKALQGALDEVRAANELAVCEGLFRCAEALEKAGKTEEAQGLYDRLCEAGGAHQVCTGALRGAVLVRKEEGLPLLLEALRDEDYLMAEAAARTAQEMEGAAATKALVDELAKLSADRQILVIQTLGDRGDAAAVPELSAAAKNGEKPVRLAAIRSLTMIGDAKAKPVLEGLAGDSDGDIQQAAKQGLSAL